MSFKEKYAKASIARAIKNSGGVCNNLTILMPANTNNKATKATKPIIDKVLRILAGAINR